MSCFSLLLSWSHRLLSLSTLNSKYECINSNICTDFNVAIGVWKETKVAVTSWSSPSFYLSFLTQVEHQCTIKYLKNSADLWISPHLAYRLQPPAKKNGGVVSGQGFYLIFHVLSRGQQATRKWSERDRRSPDCGCLLNCERIRILTGQRQTSCYE